MSKMMQNQDSARVGPVML